MHYSEFSKALLLHPGIIRLELLTNDLMEEIRSIENSPLNVGFTPIDPVGYGEVCSKKLRLIAFCSTEFPMFTERFMCIVDSRGTMVGHDVLESEKAQFDSEDYIWLTSNLFFDMTLVGEHHLKSVIHSLALNVDGLDDGISPRVYYPCVESANYLNKKFGASGKVSSTVIIGVDGITFRSDHSILDTYINGYSSTSSYLISAVTLESPKLITTLASIMSPVSET